jgi:hypothetical protein
MYIFNEIKLINCFQLIQPTLRRNNYIILLSHEKQLKFCIVQSIYQGLAFELLKIILFPLPRAKYNPSGEAAPATHSGLRVGDD